MMQSYCLQDIPSHRIHLKWTCCFLSAASYSISGLIYTQQVCWTHIDCNFPTSKDAKEIKCLLWPCWDVLVSLRHDNIVFMCSSLRSVTDLTLTLQTAFSQVGLDMLMLKSAFLGSVLLPVFIFHVEVKMAEMMWVWKWWTQKKKKIHASENPLNHFI